MGRRVKIFLFIGIFFLLVGILAYGYLSYEGFQNSQTSGSFCTVNENKCQNQCINKTKEQGVLLPESAS